MNQTVPSSKLARPDLSTWRAGNTGVEGVWQVCSPNLGRHVLMTAVIHGNELCGAWALKDLLEEGLLPAHGTLTVAFCNLAAFDRFDPADVDASRFVERDMNRVWSDAELDAGETLESRRAARLLPFVRDADWILDLHSMHEQSAPLLLTGLQQRNIELARVLASPQYIVVDAGHSNGVRMRDYADFGKADDERTRSLLIECGQHTDPSSHGVGRDQVFRFLRASGIMDAAQLAGIESRWIMPDARQQWVLTVTEGVVAASDQFKFVRRFTGLEVIAEQGTLIGWNDGEPVTTPYPDCVLVMPSTRQAAKGVTVVRLATRRPA